MFLLHICKCDFFVDLFQKKYLILNFSQSAAEYFMSCFQFNNNLSITCYPGARIEEFIYDKLDKKLPSKATNAELLGQYMLDAANEFGPGTPYGQWSCF